ncbi:MAG: ATP-binding cassette domain-containing protein [Thermoguttaceae bacterium]|jgi:ABC-type sugar transport system ATPase subunit
MASLALQNLVKTFPGGIRALDDISLHVADGERVVLFGPSGSGKTTALRLIAGLEHPTGGKISIDGHIVNRLPPQQRDVAMVFQQHSLYPHLSVFGNLAFGLKLRRLGKAEIQSRVAETAAVLGIADLLKRKAWELSGGQRQRVALGRAIVRRPKIFLLDEPLSHLDAGLREQMRHEIVRLQQERLQATMIYVTHDQTEAMTIGQRIIALNNGRVQQSGDPETLYNRPANRFVASLIGSPTMNFFPGRIVECGDGLVFQSVGCVQRTASKETPSNQSPLPLGENPNKSPLPLGESTNKSPLPLGEGQGEGFADVGCVQRTKSYNSETLFSWPVTNKWKPILQPYRGKAIILGIRPEHLYLEQATAGEGSLKIPAVVEAVESLGAESHIHLRSGPLPFICRTQSNPSARVGDPLTPAANHDHLYFFDPDTGETLDSGPWAAGRG